MTKRGRQTAEKKTYTVEKTYTIGRTLVTTYTKEGYLPRRYRGEHIRSVRFRNRTGYLLR